MDFPLFMFRSTARPRHEQESRMFSLVKSSLHHFISQQISASGFEILYIWTSTKSRTVTQKHTSVFPAGLCRRSRDLCCTVFLPELLNGFFSTNCRCKGAAFKKHDCPSGNVCQRSENNRDFLLYSKLTIKIHRS